MPVAGAVSVPAERLQLLRRDLAGVAEDLRGERPVRVVAEVDLDDLDARELGLVLVQVVDLLLADRGLDDDRRQRDRMRALVHLAREVARRDVEDASRAAATRSWRPSLRHVADPELRPRFRRRSRRRRGRGGRGSARAAPRRGSSRSWLFWAAFRYSSPESTCSDQSRRKRTRRRRARARRGSPTRSASCGVSRYGSRTAGRAAGSARRARAARWYGPLVVDNDLDLGATARARRPRRRSPARARSTGSASSEVEDERGQRAPSRAPGCATTSSPSR